MTARDAISSTYGEPTAEKSSKVGDVPTVAKNAQVGGAEPPALSTLLESGELCCGCFYAHFRELQNCDRSMCADAYEWHKEAHGWTN